MFHGERVTMLMTYDAAAHHLSKSFILCRPLTRDNAGFGRYHREKRIRTQSNFTRTVTCLEGKVKAKQYEA